MVDKWFHLKPALHSPKTQHSHQEVGRNRVSQHEGSGAASVWWCFPVSCETQEGLCPFGEAKPSLLPAHPPSLPSCAKSLGQGSWLEMVFSEVRQQRGPEAWPVHGHCAQGLRPITVSHTEVCGCQWPGLPAIWSSSSSSGFFLESVAF